MMMTTKMWFEQLGQLVSRMEGEEFNQFIEEGAALMTDMKRVFSSTPEQLVESGDLNPVPKNESYWTRHTRRDIEQMWECIKQIQEAVHVDMDEQNKIDGYDVLTVLFDFQGKLLETMEDVRCIDSQEAADKKRGTTEDEV